MTFSGRFSITLGVKFPQCVVWWRYGNCLGRFGWLRSPTSAPIESGAGTHWSRSADGLSKGRSPFNQTPPRFPPPFYADRITQRGWCQHWFEQYDITVTAIDGRAIPWTELLS